MAQGIQQHHERVDGSGYPSGLADGAIILEARILAVADAVEAVYGRPYLDRQRPYYAVSPERPVKAGPGQPRRV